MRRRYLCDMLRHTHYYARSTWGNNEPDEYMLQIVDDHRMVFSSYESSDTELLKGAKAVGVPIHGQHWADYLVPENALEKRMMDDVIQLAKIVNALATVETLQALGFSLSEAKKIMKDAAYVTPEGQRLTGEGKH